MFKIINFLFFAQKVSSDMEIGHALCPMTCIMSQIFRGLAELEHPQDWGQRGSKFVFFFYCLFSVFIHLA